MTAEGGVPVPAAMNEVTRDEFDSLHTLLNEVKAQQQLHGSVNLLSPVLKSVLQSFSSTQANHQGETIAEFGRSLSELAKIAHGESVSEILTTGTL